MNDNNNEYAVLTQRTEPGCLIQALWFIFVGAWLGGVVTAAAWFLNVTIIGLPLGMMLLNNLPFVLALQSPARRVVLDGRGNTYASDLPQHNFLIRALYFVLIGWWWSGVWLALAYLLCATIIFMPIGLPMFRQTPAMTTLQRY